MKRAFVFSTGVFLLSATMMVANVWGPDIRLTTNDSISYTTTNNARCIGATGDTLYLIWGDARDSGVYEVYYKRSTDNGATWSADARLSANDSSYSTPGSFAFSGSVLHVVWVDARDTSTEIYYKRSEDAGGTWNTDTRLTTDTFECSVPSLAVQGSNVHLVWEDARDTCHEIYYKRSTNAGDSWGGDTRLSTKDDSVSRFPSVAASGSNVHVVWSDNRDGNLETYYRRSVNNGTDWGTETRLTTNDSLSSTACIAVSGDTVHVVWCDGRDGNSELYYKRSNDNGTTWSTDARLTNDDALSSNPSIAVFGSAVHIVWYDARNGNMEIYYKYSMDNGANWSPDIRLTNNAASSYNPIVATFGLDVHVVWIDDRDGNDEIYYKHASEVRPDALIKNPADTLYVGSDTYNADATNQSVFQTAQLLSTATYQIMLENDANIPDTLRITGTAGNSQWLVGYFDALTGGNNITSTVTTAGWSSGEIAAGSSKQLRIEVIPLDTVPGDTFYDVTLTATSIRDTTKLDAIKATTLIEIIPGVGEHKPLIPSDYFLSTAATAMGSGVIRYGIPVADDVVLKVYDITGKRTDVLVSGKKEAGIYETRLDANSKLPSGVYFVRFEAGSFSKTQKVLLVR